MKRITVNPNSGAPVFWDSVSHSAMGTNLEILEQLAGGGAVEVADDTAAAFVTFCEAVPGWSEGPLLIVGSKPTYSERLHELANALEGVQDGILRAEVDVGLNTNTVQLTAAAFAKSFAGVEVEARDSGSTRHYKVKTAGITWVACEPIAPATSRVVMGAA